MSASLTFMILALELLVWASINITPSSGIELNGELNNFDAEDDATLELVEAEDIRIRGQKGEIKFFDPSPDSRYYAKFFVKLLNDAEGQLGQNLDIRVTFYLKGGQTKGSHIIAYHRLARAEDGWFQMGGDFRTPNTVALKEVRLRVHCPDSSVDFQLDGATFMKLDDDSDWRASTDEVIRNIRQSDINIQVTTGNDIDAQDVQIQIRQIKKSFPVGTAVNEWYYVVDSQWRYRQFIHDHFNWAVHESTLKWTYVERTEGKYRFDMPLRVLDQLRKNGLKIRGHTLIWSLGEAIPEWVKQLSGDRLRSTVEHHIVQTMAETRGRVEHWDVNNENLHGQWFQERLQDASYEQIPFRIAHNFDPHVRLFLNDFNVVAHGHVTMAFVEQARRLLEAQVGLDGLGAQCHFWIEEEPDPHFIKARLDELARTGLPIWITEFNVVAADENRRADFLETAMRAFYGHPAVEGILIWGFWDKAHSRGPHAALANGDQMQLNAAGRRFLDLWENQWMTDETRVLSQAGFNFTVRGFHGDYEMHVQHRGQELLELKESFTLGRSPHTIYVHVPMQTNADENELSEMASDSR